MKSEKKSRRVLSAVVTVILCAAAILCFSTILGSLLRDDPSVFGYRCFYVMTGSMEPTLPTDCLVFTRQPEDGVYEVGDIITFASDDPTLHGASNTHRIVEIRQTSDGVRYVTKGDANPAADEYTVPQRKVQGRVVHHTGKLKFVGKLVSFVMSPPGFLTVIIIPLVLVISSTVKDYIRAYKEELEKLKKGQMPDKAEEPAPTPSDEGKK